MTEAFVFSIHRRCPYITCQVGPCVYLVSDWYSREMYMPREKQHYYSTCLFLIGLLLSLSGDVHQNPGPSSHSDSSIDTSSSSYIDILNSGLSIMHINIQSIKPKLDILEIEAQPYDVLIFTETWLSPAISCDDLLIPNFRPPYRCDRIGRLGGGVAIYVRDGLTSVERNDLSINGLEALWIELHVQQRKILI